MRAGALLWLRNLPARYQEELEGLAEGAKIPLERRAELFYSEECDINQCSGVIYLSDNKVWVAGNNNTYMREL